MSHPKEAWKFRLWSEAMLRGATVGDPEYKGKGAKSTGSRASRMTTNKRQRRRRKKSSRAKKET